MRLVSLDKMADLRIIPTVSSSQLEMNGGIQVSLDRSRTTVMHFISADVDEVSNFLILCRFYILGWGLFGSGFWECDVFEAGDTMPPPGRVELHKFALSSDSEVPLKVSKMLDLARGRARRKGKRRAVTVTLEREHTGPESDPVPIFFLDVKMDVSYP